MAQYSPPRSVRRGEIAPDRADRGARPGPAGTTGLVSSAADRPIEPPSFRWGCLWSRAGARLSRSGRGLSVIARMATFDRRCVGDAAKTSGRLPPSPSGMLQQRRTLCGWRERRGGSATPSPAANFATGRLQRTMALEGRCAAGAMRAGWPVTARRRVRVSRASACPAPTGRAAHAPRATRPSGWRR